MLTALRETVWELLPPPLRGAVRVGQMALGPVLFIGGFTWDALTLSRIDAWLDNAILGAYLLALSLVLILDQRASRERLPRWMLRWSWAYGLAVHFFFGGLFSAYVVFYLRSATLGRTLAFLGLLAGLLVANEFAQRFVRGPGVRLVLYLFAAFSFLLYWIPVATGLFGRGAWMLAAIGAFVLTALVKAGMEVSPGSVPGMVRRLVYDVRRTSTELGLLQPSGSASDAHSVEDPAGSEPDPAVGAPSGVESLALPEPDAPLSEARRDAARRLDRIRRDPIARLRWQLLPTLDWGGHALSWAGLLGVLLILEVGGAIPPVPISVLHMGIYHDVDFVDGRIALSQEAPPWWRFWATDDSRWRLRDEDRVCVFAPVFSPRGLHPRLYHRWERWDAEAGVWEWTGDRGTWVQARGGRGEGSPHYTCKRHGLRAGPWRVTVETEDQRIVGTHRFYMVEGPHPELELRERWWP